jgi:integrase
MALIKLSPNQWKIRVSVRVPGKDYPVCKQEIFTGNKIEAELRRAEMIKEIRENGSRSLKIHHGVKNFSDVISLFCEKRGPFSASHQCKIDYLNRELGHVPIETFGDVFEQYLKVLKVTPTRRGKRSGASLNRYIEIARAAFGLVFNLGYVPENPVTKVRFPKLEEQRRDRYLTEEEELRVLNAIREYRPYLLSFVEYCLEVPCRKSELVKAKREQYNPFTGTIYIPDSKADIPIHKPVPENLKSYFNSIPSDCPYLFFRQSKNGKYHPLGDFKKAWAYCLKKAGISDYRVQDTRHKAVTSLIELGNNENQVADVCGWTSTAMLKNYRHIDSLKSAQAIEFQKSSECSPEVKLPLAVITR